MKIANEVRVGILGVVAIAVFTLGYNYLKGLGMWSSTRMITAVYQDVGGLKPANRIMLNGFDIGSVNDISVDQGDIKNGITVEMAVSKDIAIPKDSKALIAADGLLGTKVVKFELGSSKQLIEDEGTIYGDTEVGMIDDLAGQADPIIADLKKTLASLNEAVTGINNMLTPSTQANIRGSIANLNATMGELNDFTRTLNAQKGSITNSLNNLSGFTANLNKNNTSINRTISNLETTSQNFSNIQLEGTVTKLNATLSSLQTTLNKTNSGEGSMAMLLNDDKLYKNMKNTSETLNNLLYDLSARPYRYVNLNLFGGKKKATPPLKAPNADQ